MMSRTALLAIVAWCAVSTVPMVAGAPVVSDVNPSQGPPDEDTRVTLRGEAFPAEPGIGMLQGGPVLLATEGTGGFASGVAFEDGLVYLADGEGGLAVFDVADPSDPVTLPGLTLPGTALDLAVSNGTGYLVSRAPEGAPGGVLHLIDVTDPAAPAPITELSTVCIPHAVAVADGYAYVAGGSAEDVSCGGRLDVFDVSIAESAFPAGSLPVDGTPFDVEVANGRAFIAAGSAGLQILDVTIPTAPSWEAELPLSGESLGVDVSPGRIHVVGTEGLHVVGIDGSGVPSLTGSTAVAGDAVAGHGRFVLVSGADGLHTVDTRDPGDPAPSGYLRIRGEPHRLTVHRDLAFMAAGSSGLVVLNVQEANSPVPLVGTSSGKGSLIEVSGGRAFLANELGLVLVFDVSDPGTPVIQGLVPPLLLLVGEVGVSALFADGDLMYAARWWGDACSGGVCYPPGSTIRVLDTTVDGAPGIVSYIYLPARVIEGVASSSDRLYILEYVGIVGLEVYSVEDPSAPAYLGSSVLYPDTVSARSLAADESVLFVPVLDNVSSACRLDVFDSAEPGAPVLLGSTPMSGCAREERGLRAIAVSGDRVVVIGTGSGGEAGWLGVFDVGDPVHPAESGSLTTGRTFTGLRVDGDTAWVGTDAGVDVVDIGDPARPFLAGRYEIPGEPTDVAVEGPHAFLAGDELRALRLNPSPRDPMASSPFSAEVDVPAGCAVGPYHVRLTGEDGSFGVLHNGYRVCLPREITATLAPAANPEVMQTRRRIWWTLSLDGDDEFFGTPPSHHGLVALPALPEETELRFLPGNGTGEESIEIDLFPDAGRAIVSLAGEDHDALAEHWADCLAEGGIALPVMDERTYGPVGLSLIAKRPNGSEVGYPTGDGGVAVLLRPAERYRYVLDGGRLKAATAWGLDADLTLVARGVDSVGCESASEVSLRETREDLCWQLAAIHPDLAVRCEREAPAATDQAPRASGRVRRITH